MTNYTMSGYEIGTYMEIYLPKKTIYQPFLFNILTDGFDIERVRLHFLDPSKRPMINTLLSGYHRWSNYDDAYVARLTPFLYGYSMYEVDGVFKAPTGSQRRVDEERTQILRLIFRLDPNIIANSAGVTDMSNRDVRAKVSDYLRAHNRETVLQSAVGQDRNIFEATRDWRDQLGFFVFGYIICQLCVNIESLCSSQELEKTEDEIWVTHFANLELDRIIWSPQIKPLI